MVEELFLRDRPQIADQALALLADPNTAIGQAAPMPRIGIAWDALMRSESAKPTGP